MSQFVKHRMLKIAVKNSLFSSHSFVLPFVCCSFNYSFDMQYDTTTPPHIQLMETFFFILYADDVLLLLRNSQLLCSYIRTCNCLITVFTFCFNLTSFCCFSYLYILYCCMFCLCLHLVDAFYAVSYKTCISMECLLFLIIIISNNMRSYMDFHFSSFSLQIATVGGCDCIIS